MDKETAGIACFQKEQELLELEIEYHKQERKLEEQREELYDRHGRLGRFIEEETERIYMVLRKFEASYEEGRSLFQDLERLNEDSEQFYHQELKQLQYTEETLSEHFRYERDHLEEEYHQLRREYANIDD